MTTAAPARLSERFADALPPGETSGATLRMLAVGGNSDSDKEAFVARQDWSPAKKRAPVEYIRAPVQPISTGSGGAGLMQTTAGADFATAANHEAALFQLPGAMRAARDTRLLLNLAGRGSIVDEGAPAPPSALSVADFGKLQPRKVVSELVTTVELLQAGAEGALAVELARVDAATVDRAAFDPNAVGSLTAAGALIASSGTAETDVARLIEVVGGNHRNGAFVTDAASAGKLIAEFPSAVTLGQNARAFGLPLFIVATLDTASPPAHFLTLIDGASVLLSDGAVELSASKEASIQLADNPAAGAQNLTSLWQSNLVALRALRFVAWHLRRPNGAATITGF